MPIKIACKVDDAQKHELDINHLLHHNGKLYSASDDGKIKVWSNELKSQAEVQAHPCSVYCLAASDDTLYSCSNEGTIKSWTLDTLEEKKTLLSDPDTEFWRLSFTAGCLFAGDDQANIRVFKEDKLYGAFNIAEPVKDMAINGTMLFTSNTMDVIVTDVKLGGPKVQYGTKAALRGKAPLSLAGTKICFNTKDGKEVVVYETADCAFKKIAESKGASNMCIQSLLGVNWDSTETVFSGSYDQLVKKWKIEKDSLKMDGSCNVGFVINTLTAGQKGQIFVGGENGGLVRLDL